MQYDVVRATTRTNRCLISQALVLFCLLMLINMIDHMRHASLHMKPGRMQGGYNCIHPSGRMLRRIINN